MLDAHGSDIIEMRHTLVSGKQSALFGLRCTFDILVRHKVIKHYGHFLFIKHFGESGLFKFVDGYRCGDVIAVNKIKLCIDQLSGCHFRKTGVRSEDLLCHCHSHDYLSSRVYPLLNAETRALMPARMISVSKPAPHETLLSVQRRPT